MRIMGERLLTDGMLPEGGDLERLTTLLSRPLHSYRDFEGKRIGVLKQDALLATALTRTIVMIYSTAAVP